MSRMQTISGSAHFSGEMTGAMSADDATTAFWALLHERRRRVQALQEIADQIEAFLEARLKTDKRLSTRLRLELGRQIAAEPR